MNKKNVNSFQLSKVAATSHSPVALWKPRPSAGAGAGACGSGCECLVFNTTQQGDRSNEMVVLLAGWASTT